MSYWNNKLIIRGKEYPRFMSGPLDGITDPPFRQLVRDFSKENLLYTEMRHVACVVNKTGGPKALNFLQLERPLNFQVAANSTKFIAEACEKILDKGIDAIDLNVGCPAKNVVKSGGGSSLMAKPELLKSILLEFRKNLPDIPFTIKIRAGYKDKNALDIAKLAQDCGIDALAIHPRLQTEKFLGRPDYNLAYLVKKSLDIPVLISGNVVNWQTAKLVYEQTGVDGFLIGRGMWAKPWKLLELEKNSQNLEFKLEQNVIFGYALKQLNLMLDYYGPRGLLCFRKHLPFYFRGFSEAQTMRKKLIQSNSITDIQNCLKDLSLPKINNKNINGQHINI